MTEKKSTVGDPIWIESVLSTQEYREVAKSYPALFSNGPIAPHYDKNHYKDGKWRAGMGDYLNRDEAKMINDRIALLYKMVTNEKLHKNEHR